MDQILQTTTRVHRHDIAILEIGSNDAASALVDIAHGRLSVDAFAKRLADTVIGQLDLLKQKGFMRILLVNLPALQHTPIVKLKHRENVASAVVSAYNELLEAKAGEWQKHAGLDQFALIDLARFVDTAIGPAVTRALNITDTKSFCVGGGSSSSWLGLFDDELSLTKVAKYLVAGSGSSVCHDPGSHFYFDPIHPADRVHRLFGYCVYQVIAGYGKGLSAFEFSEDNLIAVIAAIATIMSAQSSNQQRQKNIGSSPVIDTNPEQPPVYVYDWSSSEDMANWSLTSLSTNSIDTSFSSWSSLMTPSPEYVPNDESGENVETLAGSFVLEYV
ncbi:hypothetical protein GGH95_001000 [Coemansia sp. RSA 1836]|nr:hypothetical protein GGH95_001000 [Coemansia sp. RSA 1836]